MPDASRSIDRREQSGRHMQTRDPQTRDPQARDSQARDSQARNLLPTAQTSAPDEWTRRLRLGFEAFLVALCGYLIGVAGLPPLFDAPGSSPSLQTVGSEIAASPQTTSTAAAAASDAGAALPGSGVPVTLGRATWSTGYFQAAVVKVLLEELGYQVSDPSINEQGPSEMYRKMAEGEVDMWTNSWIPNHRTFIDEQLDDGSSISTHVSTVGQLLPSGGLEGVMITKSVAEQYQISSLEQINGDPNLVELFDVDGNGKAEIYGCPDDWSCDDILDETIEFNGWLNLEQVKGDYDTMVEASVDLIDAGNPVLQYTWSPSGYLTRLRPGDNVLWVSLGSQDKMLDGSITPAFDFDEMPAPELGAACTQSPCYLGWPAADISVTVSNSFLEANPAARVLFEQIELKVLDVALANVRYDTGEDTEADLERHAVEWVGENRAMVDTWLGAARAVELEAAD